MNCQTCGAPMRPAGISQKTGRPYNSFCTNENCPTRQRTGTSSARLVNPSYTPINNEETKWKKINEEKNDHIKWLNALNNATILASTGKIELKDIKVTAQKIYVMQPLGVKEENYEKNALPQVRPAAQPKTTYNEDLPDDDIKVDEIPF